MRERTSSAFAKQLDDSGSIISITCKSFIDHKDKRIETAQDFISFANKYEFLETDFQKLIIACGNIGSVRPLESFDFLISSFSNIEITGKDKPTSTMNFANSLVNVNWGDKYHRASIRFIINYLIANITAVICEKSFSEKGGGENNKICGEFLQKITDYVIQNESDSFTESVNVLVADHWKRAVSFLSVGAKETAFELANNYFSGLRNNSEKSPVLILKLFSEAMLGFKNLTAAVDLINPLYLLYCGEKAKNEAAAAMLNVIGQTFVQFKEFREDNILIEYFKKVRCYRDEISLELLSLIETFTTNSSIKYSLNDFSTRFLLGESNNLKGKMSHILKSLTRCLFHTNYLPKTLQYRENIHFSWQFPDYSQVSELLTKVIQSIKNNKEKGFQKELVEFILQIACNDLKSFAEEILPQLVKERIVFTSCSEEIFAVLSHILSIHTNFLKSAKNATETVIQKLKKDGKDLCSQFLVSPSKTPVIYITPSLVNELNIICTPMKHSIIDIHRVLLNPLKPANETWPTPKLIVTVVGRWVKNIPIIDDLNDKTPKELQELMTPIPINSAASVGKISVFQLAPLVFDDFSLLKKICGYILNENATIGAAAVRALQASIHLNRSFVSQIIVELFNQLIESNLSDISLFTLISTLRCIIETFGFEEIVLEEKDANKIIEMLSLGLFSPHYQIRDLALHCTKIIPHSRVNVFFQHVEDVISERSRDLIFKTIAPGTENVSQKDVIKFGIVVGCNNHLVYIFYLVAYAEILLEPKYKDLLNSVREMLFGLMAKSKQLLSSPLFVANISAVLFTIFDDKKSIVNLVAQFNKQNLGYSDLWLSAATALVPVKYSQDIFDVLSPRAFANYLLRCCAESEYIFADEQCKTLSPKFLKGYSNFVNDIFASGSVSKKGNFLVDENKSNKFRSALYNFGQSMTIIFESIAQKNTEDVGGLLPRNPATKLFTNEILTTNESITFWFNVSSGDKLYFSHPCQTAFCQLAKIITIPDELFDLLAKNLEKIVSHTHEIAIPLFTRFHNVLLPIYLKNSQTHFSFFAGIAKQLCNCDSFFTRWEITVSQKFNGDDSLTFLILRNLGTLLAIATSYLMGKEDYQRITAYDFIYVSSLSAHLLYSRNVKETILFSQSLLAVRETFKTNLAQYFSTAVNDIIYLLAKYLPFLSEQFISQCFAIESIKGAEVALNKAYKAPPKSQGLILPKSEGLLGIRPVSFSSLSKINFVNKVEKKRKILLVESEANEICRYVASFIIPWTENVCYNPEQQRIFEKCLPSYQAFSMYDFLYSIAKLSCLLPISPPITTIMYPTYRAAGSFFLITISEIYFLNKSYRERCVAMLTYAYSIDLKAVMDHFTKNLTARFWYFHQIQTSKLYQTFDFRKFLQDLGSDFGTDNDQSMIADYNDNIKFTLKTLISFYKENPDGVVPYKSTILTFCALFFNTYRKYTEEIFLLLLGLESAGSSGAAHMAKSSVAGVSVNEIKDLNSIGPFTFKSILRLFEPFHDIADFLIEWGLICGDSFIASLALKMFIAKKFTIDEKHLKCALMSIKMIALVLRDAVVNKDRERFNLMKLINGNIPDPDTQNAYSHIEHLLLLCQHIIDPSENIIHQILLTSISLLQLESIDQTAIVTTALQNINLYISHLTKISLPKNLSGLSRLLCTTILGAESMKLCENIFVSIMEDEKMINILGSSQYDVHLAVYAVVPFVFAAHSTHKTEICIKSVPIRQNFINVASNHNEEALENFHNVSKKNVQFEYLLKFYLSIIKLGSIPQIKAALFLSAFIISDKLVDIKSLIVGDLAREALKKNEYELQEASNSLFTAVMQTSLGEVAAPKTVRQPFPEIISASKISKILEWKPKVDADIFKDVELYPPLFLTDFSLFVSNFMQKLKNVVEQVKVQPFTQWADNVFNEQAQQKQEDIFTFSDENEKKIFLQISEEEIKVIGGEVLKYASANNNTGRNDAKLKRSMAEDTTVKFCLVDTEIFCPNIALVNSVNLGNEKQSFPPIV